MPHKAAAWALAARAALYAAQFDAKYYDTVIEMCDKVMGLTGADKRELFDDGTDKAFANLWRKQQNFGCEYIFSLLGNAVDGPKFHGMSFQNGRLGPVQPLGLFPAHPFPVERIRIGRHPPRRDDHLPRADDPLHGPGHRIRQQLLFDLLGYRHVVPQIPLPVGRGPTAKARR